MQKIIVIKDVLEIFHLALAPVEQNYIHGARNRIFSFRYINAKYFTRNQIYCDAQRQQYQRNGANEKREKKTFNGFI